MKNVIIVSKCLRVTKIGQDIGLYDFHFKGVCMGESLNKVVLSANYSFGIRTGEEYLLFVENVSFCLGTLKGRVVKLKLLSECWDRS